MVKRLLWSEAGQSVGEYGLLALAFVLVIAILTVIARKVRDIHTTNTLAFPVVEELVG